MVTIWLYTFLVETDYKIDGGNANDSEREKGEVENGGKNDRECWETHGRWSSHMVRGGVARTEVVNGE